jgi:hypothetical protein
MAVLVRLEEEAGTNSRLPELPVILFDPSFLRTPMNKSLLLASLIAVFALSACGKKEEAAAAVDAAASAAAPAVDAAASAAAAVTEAASAATDAASAVVDAAASAASM